MRAMHSLENQTDEMIAAFMGTSRNTNACESFFGSIKYYEQMFHCGVANANGVVAAQVDELFDVIAPKFQPKGKQRVADERASKSTMRKRRKLSQRSGRLAKLDSKTEEAIMEVSRTTGVAEVHAQRALSCGV